MAELRTKGAGIASFIAVVRERLTPSQIATLEQHLPPAALALFRRRVLAVEWVPIAEQTHIGEVLLGKVLGGNEQEFLAIVHEASQRDLAGIYKLLLRVMSPEYVAERASKIFRTYVDGAEMTVAPVSRAGGRKRFLVDVTGYHGAAHAWLTLRGYIEAPLLMTGAKNLQVRLIKSQTSDATATLQYSVEYDS